MSEEKKNEVVRDMEKLVYLCGEINNESDENKREEYREQRYVLIESYGTPFTPDDLLTKEFGEWEKVKEDSGLYIIYKKESGKKSVWGDYVDYFFFFCNEPPEIIITEEWENDEESCKQDIARTATNKFTRHRMLSLLQDLGVLDG